MQFYTYYRFFSSFIATDSVVAVMRPDCIAIVPRSHIRAESFRIQGTCFTLDSKQGRLALVIPDGKIELADLPVEIKK
jgi:hypothetical protein